ncbi:hypothetical protein DPMN_058222 [Dreissena polymorpha]|uniref:Uncharacterized protein n=1 Tax=Dreissena polymorpha TaxID=45954 RepID=A0A9D4C1C3_DREPO|nr:hypothetical protein DPMN_058222 [Dreissena polymorpha]
MISLCELHRLIWDSILRTWIKPCFLGAIFDFLHVCSYGLYIDNDLSGYLKCKPEGTFVGNTNYTFLVEAPFGRYGSYPADTCFLLTKSHCFT